MYSYSARADSLDFRDRLFRPTLVEVPTPAHSTARHHPDFDDDVPTLLSTRSCILDKRVAKAQFQIHRAAQSTSAWRRTL